MHIYLRTFLAIVDYTMYIFIDLTFVFDVYKCNFLLTDLSLLTTINIVYYRNRNLLTPNSSNLYTKILILVNALAHGTFMDTKHRSRIFI